MNDQTDIMQQIQDMIGGLLKNTVDKIHKADIGDKLGDSEAGKSDEAEQTSQMGIAEVKNFIDVMQKFIDNVKVMVTGLETGSVHPGSVDDKFVEGYMATADNVLEIAAFSARDSLTGLSNRYGFDNRLILEWNRATRDKSSLGLVIFGMSDYEGCDDNTGRDEFLKTFSKIMESTIKRSTDFIARWSDNELAALLPITDENGAKIVTDRIISEAAKLNTAALSGKGGIPYVSVGVCVHPPEPNEEPADFVNKANDAYKKAKATEKNFIVFA